MTPYLAFWVPAHLGGSGVLATVACGLYVSWNGPRLIPFATRLQGIFFWDLIVYLIEGMVFLLTGLQARTLIEQTHVFSIHDLLIATAWTTLIVIVARFVWVFPATYIPRWVNPRFASATRHRLGKVLSCSFTGVRGVVSLAAALAIPYALDNGAPFPHRELILFVTFGVIIFTLIGQGLMLPTVVRWLGLLRGKKSARTRSSRARARQAALKEVTKRLEKRQKLRPAGRSDRAFAHAPLSRVQILPKDMKEGLDHMRLSANIKKELIDAERDFIYRLLRDGKITDEARRRIEYELDLEEARSPIAQRMAADGCRRD